MAGKVDGIVESTDAQALVPGSAAEALKKHEAAKMSRRAVLSKVGLQFGAAALLALSVDDLARKVTATIAARNKDNEVAQSVAREFKNAGIAFAEPSASWGCPGCPSGYDTRYFSCESCGIFWSVLASKPCNQTSDCAACCNKQDDYCRSQGKKNCNDITGACLTNC